MRANDLSDKLCVVCRHIVFWILIEILCTSFQQNWTLTGKKLVLASALRLFSKTWSNSGMIGESRCKAARRGHTLCSRKRNKVKSNETGGWKPPDTTSPSQFMLIFLQFYPVFFPCFFTLSSLCPYLMSPVDRRKCLCMDACMYECCSCCCQAVF